MKIIAPWTLEQVKALERWQADDHVHPFTCPGDRDFCHLYRELIPMPDGWVCACGRYRQDWAHDFMMRLP